MASLPARDGASEPQDPHVILVDNDPAVLGALKFLLELEGLKVLTFRSGSELLAARALPQSGCLVVDFRLPEMNGLDLIAALRGRGVYLPAILVTSHPTTTLRRRAAEETTPIIEKPLLGDALTEAIRSMLNRGGANAH